MTARPRRPGPATSAALRAEPRGIGTAGARDPLAAEVRLLGALLGQVIIEQQGVDAFELVERIRRHSIAHRREADGQAGVRLEAELDGLTAEQASILVRAFSLYFQLVNLAEERDQVRQLRLRERRSRGVPDDSVAAAVVHLREKGFAPDAIDKLLGRLALTPVLTAHPTEARRRTMLLALRRCYAALERLDDRRLSPGEDREIRRRLREEISLLWRTAAVRSTALTPLDEVRSLLAFLDETLFRVVPRVYRAVGAAVWPDEPEAPVPAYLRWGSWVGGDRDGNPAVTSATTEEAARIAGDHVLHGYEAVATRLAGSIAAWTPADRLPAPLAAGLRRDRDDLPDLTREIAERFPDEPYRARLLAIAERLRRTRGALAGGRAPLAGRYEDAAALLADLDDLADALVEDGLWRVASGEIRDLRWQVATFGFHALSLEVRQHAEVHAAALGAIERGELDIELAVGSGLTAGEVLATFRAMARIQRRLGSDACRRYVISFTRGARDVLDVLDLADAAGRSAIAATATGGFAPDEPVLDIVPLFESADALEGAGIVLDELLADPRYRAHLRARGWRQEVMLGYSDSNKESGFLAASWMLHRAQGQLARVARRHDVELTIFHGRGGAIGRGGGPAARAIRALAPGSVDGRLKLTEQGEVIAAHFSNPVIAARELDRMTAATLEVTGRDELGGGSQLAGGEAGDCAALIDELAATSRSAYRALVWENAGFASFFRAATPIEQIGRLRLGSRPAARPGRSGADDEAWLDSLRAIPWVFAWSQSRIGLPGWYGLGTALRTLAQRHGESGLDVVASCYRNSPFLSSVLDNAESVLAQVDLAIGSRYAGLAGDGAAADIWRRIVEEHQLAVELLLRVTGRHQLLEGQPGLQRSIRLRTPYVDALSELQVRLLPRLRSAAAGSAEEEQLGLLVLQTINGIAAGLQTTG